MLNVSLKVAGLASGETISHAGRVTFVPRQNQTPETNEQFEPVLEFCGCVETR